MVRTARSSFVILALVAFCSTPAWGQDVSFDYDKKADFSRYKTFSIEVGTEWGNPISEDRVLDEFTSAFKAKGWTLVSKDTAAAQVVIHGATETRKDLNTFYSGYGGYRYGGFGTTTTTVSEYTVGTLVVDVFDARTKTLLWRGTAQDELRDKPEKREKQLAKTSDKLLKNFPPAKAKN